VSELWRLDATAQAELVREKSVRPIELVEAAIKRIERLNPKLNAVVTLMYDRARAEASVAVAEGPFAAVAAHDEVREAYLGQETARA